MQKAASSCHLRKDAAGWPGTMAIRGSESIQPAPKRSWALRLKPRLRSKGGRVDQGDTEPDAHTEIERHPGDLGPPLLPIQRDAPTRRRISEPLERCVKSRRVGTQNGCTRIVDRMRRCAGTDQWCRCVRLPLQTKNADRGVPTRVHRDPRSRSGRRSMFFVRPADTFLAPFMDCLGQFDTGGHRVGQVTVAGTVGALAALIVAGPAEHHTRMPDQASAPVAAPGAENRTGRRRRPAPQCRAAADVIAAVATRIRRNSDARHAQRIAGAAMGVPSRLVGTELLRVLGRLFDRLLRRILVLRPPPRLCQPARSNTTARAESRMRAMSLPPPIPIFSSLRISALPSPPFSKSGRIGILVPVISCTRSAFKRTQSISEGIGLPSLAAASGSCG